MPTFRAKKSLLRLRVTAAAEAALRAGHPWLFSESVREQNRAGQTGELAVIYDRRDQFLAIGLFDAESPLRVRVLHAGKPVTLDADWWCERLRSALARRAGWFDEQTTGYRYVHGESDGWPGLVLDRYGSTLVLKLYTAAWLPRLEAVAGLIHSELEPERLVLRLSRNAQVAAERDFGWTDGQFLANAALRPREGSEDSEGTHADSPSLPSQSSREGSKVIFLETDVRFEVDVVRGQKTGFFLDQRENRRRVEKLARGRAVLNAFSFSGGFSLYAARGGAASATDLDISPHALTAAKRNFALNVSARQIAQCRHETIQADAFEWLHTNSARKFGLVILDPPSLAKREAERARALGAYSCLVTHGIHALHSGGVLVAASCSSHVPADEFFETVRAAAKRSNRGFRELETTGHPADHPATFPEAEYLKCIYLVCARS
jgi:23S rRNA (cytosine1962-C5)-methyltransferase